MNQIDSTTKPLDNVTKAWPRILRYWLPPLCWMALIFFFSSLPGSSLKDLGPLDFFVKKGGHITEYAILNLLVFRALHSILTTRKALIVSAIITVLYAISDEYHQTFVPLREGTVRDVFIDSLGIFLSHLILRRTRIS